MKRKKYNYIFIIGLFLLMFLTLLSCKDKKPTPTPAITPPPQIAAAPAVPASPPPAKPATPALPTPVTLVTPRVIPSPTPEPTTTPMPPGIPAIPAPAPAFFLSVNEPRDETVFTSSPVRVSGGTALDAMVSVNGRIVEVNEDGAFNTTVSLLEGPNVLEITASDFEGNRAASIITIIYIP